MNGCTTMEWKRMQLELMRCETGTMDNDKKMFFRKGLDSDTTQQNYADVQQFVPKQVGKIVASWGGQASPWVTA